MTISDQVCNIVAETSGLYEKNLRSRSQESGLWDSFSHIEIIVKCERIFEVKFTDSEMMSAVSPDALCELVEKKLT